MKKVEDLNYYELLEVSPTATAQEIHKAYERVRRVYEPNSVALYSLFTPEETSAIYQRVEEAYRTLIYDDNRRRYDAQLREQREAPDMPPLPPHAAAPPPKYQPQPAPQPAASYIPPLPDRSFENPALPPAPAEPQREAISPVSQLVTEFTGAAIKVLREQKNLSIRNIADMTKVSARYLEFIEEESFKKLPARAYVRGFLILYAKALGCDAERVISDYLARYDAATGFPHALRKKPEL